VGGRALGDPCGVPERIRMLLPQVLNNKNKKETQNFFFV
jgi:hypothetical protein